MVAGDVALFLILKALSRTDEAGRLLGQILGRIMLISGVVAWGMFGWFLKRWRRARLLVFASLVFLAQLLLIIW